MNLVISIDEISTYFHTQLINCHISENYLEIDVKIPLKNSEKEYKIYEITPVPFFSNNKICKITTDELSLIHISEPTRPY